MSRVESFFDTLCFPLFIYHTPFKLCCFSQYLVWENSSVKLCKMDRFRSFPCFRRAMDRPNIAEEVLSFCLVKCNVHTKDFE